MKEIDNISTILSKLKSDLKSKEALLRKMETALENSEERLQKKVAEIEEKDKRLSEIEGKLLKRQEDLRIQEKELQTNAVLEYLSFQAREMEIQKLMERAPDPDAQIKMSAHLEDYKRKLEIRDKRIAELEMAIERSSDKGASLSDHDTKRIEATEKEMEELKESLSKKEKELMDREEELLQNQKRTEMGMSEEDKKIMKVITEREAEIRKMEESVKNRQREINQVLDNMEMKENRIKDLQDELRMKDQLIRMKEESAQMIEGSSSPDIEEIRSKIEKGFTSRIEIMEQNYRTKLDEALKKMDQLKTRNEELEMMGDQLSSEKLRTTLLERELKDRMNEIQFAEERLQRRHELMLKERKQIDEQAKKMSEMKEGKQVAHLNEELANREKQLRDIENKLREKEEYLRKKERDLRGIESQIVDKDIMLEAEIESQAGLNRVRTGVRRFDDLCYGGFEPNSNFILYGPAYSGRRTFTNLYIAEGLKKGIPTIYVSTQHTPHEIKEQLRRLIPKIDVYEEKGLIKYIDMYSRSMGITEQLENTIYIEKSTDLEALENAISTFQEEFKGKYPYHKIVFFSLSTLLTYIEPLSIFRFFQILNAKNKRANAVSIYVIDTGMHDQSVIQTLKHVMTGFIEFKLEDLKYFLRIEGGGDVMSRAWIEYSFTDKSFDLRGSFSLDHIR
ncbi:MAG: ATPase domain-containing protein [Candidatus Thermoplasmatota archaeon]|nr:ATPase domain-containing protein [Candidatus Thermoplasmatota archaeon]